MKVNSKKEGRKLQRMKFEENSTEECVARWLQIMRRTLKEQPKYSTPCYLASRMCQFFRWAKLTYSYEGSEKAYRGSCYSNDVYNNLNPRVIKGFSSVTETWKRAKEESALDWLKQACSEIGVSQEELEEIEHKINEVYKTGFIRQQGANTDDVFVPCVGCGGEFEIKDIREHAEECKQKLDEDKQEVERKAEENKEYTEELDMMKLTLTEKRRKTKLKEKRLKKREIKISKEREALNQIEAEIAQDRENIRRMGDDMKKEKQLLKNKQKLLKEREKKLKRNEAVTVGMTLECPVCLERILNTSRLKMVECGHIYCERCYTMTVKVMRDQAFIAEQGEVPTTYWEQDKMGVMREKIKCPVCGVHNFERLTKKIFLNFASDD